MRLQLQGQVTYKGKSRTGSAEPVEAGTNEFQQQVGIVGWLAAAVLIGALAAVAVLTVWLPSLSAATTGVEPKAYWYLSRSSAFVAYVMLWASMAFGPLISNKLGRLWPGCAGSVPRQARPRLVRSLETWIAI